MIFAALFVPLMVMIALVLRLQGKTRNILLAGLKAKGWSEAAKAPFICPPFLKDYKSIVHHELYKDNAVVQIVEHRMPFKIYLDTVSFSCKLTNASSSHVFLLDKKMGPPRSTVGLSVTSVAAPNVNDKYVAYAGDSAAEVLLNKIAAIVEPICDDLPYTCIELQGADLYVTVVTHGMTGDKLGVISDRFNDIAKKLDVTLKTSQEN